jgi:uncharacterized protein YecT (DUF1311 family)
MVDYSEAFLRLDKSLRSVYELMLKNKKDEAEALLLEMAQIAVITASWIKNEDNEQV